MHRGFRLAAQDVCDDVIMVGSSGCFIGSDARYHFVRVQVVPRYWTLQGNIVDAGASTF